MSRKKYPYNEKSLGGRLRFFRNSKGYTSPNFAKLLGISQGSLSDIENNKTKPSAGPIDALIQKTDINIYWLFSGKGNPFISKDRGGDFSEGDPLKEILYMTRDILGSETEYSDSLVAHITSSHRSLELERRTLNLERKCEKLEKDIKNQINRIEGQINKVDDQQANTNKIIDDIKGMLQESRPPKGVGERRAGWIKMKRSFNTILN